MKILQGDSYPIPVEITQDDVPVTPELVEEVEITIGDRVRKTYTGGDVFYEDEMWYFMLSQEDTFSLSGGYEVLLRLKYPGSGNVVGTKIGKLSVEKAQRKEVI
jgi:hypothetical protein